MPAEEAPEREQRMWMRIRPSPGAPQPTLICSTLTPFPFWLVVASIIIFLPLALVVSFFVRRQAVIVEGESVLVLEISFWRYDVRGELVGFALGHGDVAIDGKVLVVDGQRLHIEPGWLPSAEQIVALNDAAATAPPAS